MSDYSYDLLTWSGVHLYNLCNQQSSFKHISRGLMLTVKSLITLKAFSGGKIWMLKFLSVLQLRDGESGFNLAGEWDVRKRKKRNTSRFGNKLFIEFTFWKTNCSNWFIKSGWIINKAKFVDICLNVSVSVLFSISAKKSKWYFNRFWFITHLVLQQTCL